MSGHERPVFVDDSGVRRVVLRSAWLLVLGVMVVVLVSGALNLLLGDSGEAGALMPTSVRGPYPMTTSAMALPAAPTTASACSSVAGEVFIDWDLNGWRSTESDTETGVAGIDVVAYDEAGVAIAATSTADDGSYRMDLGQPRHVRLEFSSAMTAYIESPVGRWSGTATQFPVAPGCTADLGVMWRHTATDPVDAAARRGVGQVSGHVWLDANCNGLLDPGESAVATEVQLRDADTGWHYAGTTSDSGAFMFGGLEPGAAYQVVLPGADATSAGPTGLTRNAIDGGVVMYSADARGAGASFVLEEAGQSRHGLRFPIAPALGCAPNPA